MLREKITLTALLVAPVAQDVITAIGGERTELARLTMRTHTTFPIGENAARNENLNDLLIACREEFLDRAAPLGLLQTHMTTVVVFDIRNFVPNRRLHS